MKNCIPCQAICCLPLPCDRDEYASNTTPICTTTYAKRPSNTYKDMAQHSVNAIAIHHNRQLERAVITIFNFIHSCQQGVYCLDCVTLMLTRGKTYIDLVDMRPKSHHNLLLHSCQRGVYCLYRALRHSDIDLMEVL